MSNRGFMNLKEQPMVMNKTFHQLKVKKKFLNDGKKVERLGLEKMQSLVLKVSV